MAEQQWKKLSDQFRGFKAFILSVIFEYFFLMEQSVKVNETISK